MVAFLLAKPHLKWLARVALAGLIFYWGSIILSAFVNESRLSKFPLEGAVSAFKKAPLLGLVALTSSISLNLFCVVILLNTRRVGAIHARLGDDSKAP